jgi:amidohydrolase
MKLTSALTTSILPGLIDLRRTLHTHPELAYNEFETSRMLKERLERLPGMHLKADIAKTGIVATLGADLKGPCIALRADMDALPIKEQTEKSYASKRDGVMHACGHDGHMACLFGTAQVLSEMRHQLSGPVKFIFQPAEEDGAGAHQMCQAGALENPSVDAIFVLHGWPELTVGSIAITDGAIMAGNDDFSITVQGTGAHAAQPHRSVDPILVASHIVVALQSVVSRRTSPVESIVVTVGKIESGTSSNIIPESALLHGTLRALDEEARRIALLEIDQISSGIAQSYGATSTTSWQHGYPSVVNNSDAASFVREIATDTLGAVRVDNNVFPVMAAEDFSYYQKQIPGAFFALGLKPHGRLQYPGLHNPQFDFNDDAIAIGVRMFSELALNFAPFWAQKNSSQSLIPLQTPPIRGKQLNSKRPLQ